VCDKKLVYKHLHEYEKSITFAASMKYMGLILQKNSLL